MIYAVDTIRYSLISKIDISDINNEPEGIEVTDDGLILGYGFDYTKFYVITT